MDDPKRRNFSDKEVAQLVESLKQGLTRMTIDKNNKVVATWEDWCAPLAREVAQAVLNSRPKK